VGYSLGPSDNHILSLVREFLCRGNTRLIFCFYQESGDMDCNAKKTLESLRLPKQIEKRQIEIVLNNGDAEKLSARIQDILTGIR